MRASSPARGAAAGGSAPSTRFRDPRFQAVAVKIGPGEHHVTASADEMIVTVLGSCVAACVRDPGAGVGGMNHFMLPKGACGVTSGSWGGASESLRYGNVAMERLINDVLRRGGRRGSLEIKVFGGARMIGGSGGGGMVGPRNADFVEAYLQAEGLPIAARHLRGDHARRVNYFPLTGRALVLELPRDDGGIASAEAGYHAKLKTEPADGTVELFE